MAAPDEDLKQFFACYFHQDWVDDHASWKDVAQYFASEVPADTTLRIAAAIEKLSLSQLSDKGLSQVVQDMGCYYWPGADAGYRDWLAQLALELRRHLAD